ncbi:MAG: tRNA (adenosine(37)-N6)-threonylcarbamoyltransferase complex ATPase subunit type 1 TsaE [Chloroflexi bacterium]|nr:tRNA (adenosine(37)-N6)-threonylcarbamoyltransferase complex ATPase subunit type 1 TsaE [Chloroflexota bacterium]
MPIMDEHNFEFFSRSPEQTRRLGSRIGSLLKPGDLICLSGDLGAGKTTFVQGIAHGWESVDTVSSPTFVIVNEYHRKTGETLFHMDAYRLESSMEAFDLDLDRMLEQGALLVEWAERIKDALPDNALWIKMNWMADEQRGLWFTATGPRSQVLMDEFKKKVVGA